MPPPSPPECLYCGCDQLGSPDDPPVADSFIICGNCCSLHVLEGDDEGNPLLRKLSRLERHQAGQDPGVRAFLDAYQLAQMEVRIGAGAEKSKRKGPGDRVRHGDVVRLELKGPDAR